jgi:uncharacterized protein with GYD domain
MNEEMKRKMPFYLLQESMPSETWKALLEGNFAGGSNPLNDPERLKKAFEQIGGRLHSSWLSCVNCELTYIVEMPNNVDVTSLALVNLARGNKESMRITPLLSLPEEGVSVLSKAASILPKAKELAYKVRGVDY